MHKGLRSQVNGDATRTFQRPSMKSFILLLELLAALQHSFARLSPTPSSRLRIVCMHIVSARYIYVYALISFIFLTNRLERWITKTKKKKMKGIARSLFNAVSCAHVFQLEEQDEWRKPTTRNQSRVDYSHVSCWFVGHSNNVANDMCYLFASRTYLAVRAFGHHTTARANRVSFSAVLASSFSRFDFLNYQPHGGWALAIYLSSHWVDETGIVIGYLYNRCIRFRFSFQVSPLAVLVPEPARAPTLVPNKCMEYFQGILFSWHLHLNIASASVKFL